MEGPQMTKMVCLNGSNYLFWRNKMKDLLFVKKLHLPVFAEKKPESKSEEDWMFEHEQVCGFIRQYVDDNVYNHICNESDARRLWEKLETLFASKTGNNKMFTLMKFMQIKYKEGRPLADHLNEYQGILDQLARLGMVIDDEILGLYLLGTLPDTWEVFRVSFTNSSQKTTLEDAKSAILNEEIRRRSQGTSSQSEVLVAEGRGRSEERNPDRGSQSRSKSRSKKDIKCYHCGKKGHMKKNCFKWKREQGKDQGRPDQKGGNDRVNHTTSDEFLFIRDMDDINIACHESTWVVDSGATIHATARREYFSTYTPWDQGEVRMGNDGLCRIAGAGDIQLETSNGARLVLRDARHVPDLRANLISTGKLDDEGFCSVFRDGQWKLTKGALMVAKGVKDSSLYFLTAKPTVSSVVHAVAEVSADLWHQRLGHMGWKGVQMLAKKGLLSELKDFDTDKNCGHCLAGKQNRVTFKASTPTRQPGVLDLVHSDLCGPMKTRSLGGATYFITFIDDYSRKVWAYPLKSKDQALSVFKQFQASVERETGRKLKCIRSDNGGEYIGPFNEYCRSEGIRHEQTPPKTPQLNGKAERLNRTLLERVRSMLSQSNLPKSFWGEALNTAVYLINRSPCIPLQYDTPQAVWSGKECSYKHLRVFGCRASVHIPKDERSKLDSKARDCVFIGYGLDQLGFRFYDPKEKKLIRSRDAVFFEDQTVEDIRNGSSQPEEGVTTEIEPIQDDQSQKNQVSGGPDEHRPTPAEQQPTPDIQQPSPDDEQPVEFDTDQNENVQPTLRRSARIKALEAKKHSIDYVLLTDGGEPESFYEAVQVPEKQKWMEAMEDELKSLDENQTYELVRLPQGRRALKNKWVFRIKSEQGSTLPRYKARLVVKGFSQREGIDFGEIFSPVVKISSIRTVLGIAACLDLEIEQMDVKTAFLHGDLEEEIYMEQPEGFQVKGKEDLVCKLRKSLYGLKQAPRQWYIKFDSFMQNHGYRKTTGDHCVFFKGISDNFLLLLLYVDDMLIVGKDRAQIANLKGEMNKFFAMKDLGAAKKILGMVIVRDRKAKKIYLSQESYIMKILQKFNMKDCKPVSTPLATHFKLTTLQCPSTETDLAQMARVPYASAVGSLMYAMVCTRPDIAFAVGVVSRYLSNPGKEHWEAVKWILRYLRGSSNICLCFGMTDPVLVGFTDADMAGDVDTRRSTSGYLLTFSGGAVAWQSKLQKCVALSTTEAEFIAATEAGKEILWMKKFLQELGFQQEKYPLQCDSQSAIHLSKNSTFHSRSKHIDVRYHWIRDALDERKMEIVKVHTDDNGADMMTKSLPRDKFEDCCRIAGLVSTSD